MSEEKVAFFITPIGGPDSDERKRSDNIKESMIKPALEGLGFNCVRADEFPEPGRIDMQVINTLLNADLVIADLSDQNANVFYELAVRHASQKPVILLCEEGQKLPFDILTHRTIFYDLHNGPKFFQAQKELRRQIEAVTTDDFVPDSPIKEALLQRSPPETSDLKEVATIVRTNASILNEMQNEIKNIKNYVDKLQHSIGMRELAREALDTQMQPRVSSRMRIFEALKESHKPLTYKEISEFTDIPDRNARYLLYRMRSSGTVQSLDDGTFILSTDTDGKEEQ